MDKRPSDQPDHKKTPSLGDTELWPDGSTRAADEGAAAGLLSEEQAVFTDLIEDVLQSAEGLRYHRLVGRELIRGREDEPDDGTFAVFVIESGPEHELEVSIELARREFRIHVNDIPFVHRMEDADVRRPDKWVNKRCVDVEHLMKGDLRLETHAFFDKPVWWDLHAGGGNKWRQIGHRDSGWGWLTMLSWLLPFGIPLIQREQEDFVNWPAGNDTGGD